MHGKTPRPEDVPQVRLAPWLSVRDSEQALAFYRDAFGAEEATVIRLPGTGGVIARLSLGDGEFWMSNASPEHGHTTPLVMGACTARMILTTADPHAAVARALFAGATEVAPVTEAHGWLLGRVRDPSGHTWEIGRPLAPEDASSAPHDTAPTRAAQTKPYVLTTGVAFGLLALAHLLRIALEGSGLLREPAWVAITIAAAAMAGWAWRLALARSA